MLSKLPLNHQLKGTLLVALSGTLYGVLGYFGTQVMHTNMSVECMLFWRFFIAMIWMALPLLLHKRSVNNQVTSKFAYFKIILLGAITYSGSSALYFMASKQIGTGIAMVIFFSYPVFVTLFAWVFNHWKMNLPAFLSLLVVIIGLLLLKGHGDETLNIMGILLCILSAIFYATYLYGSQHTTKLLDTRILTFLICMGNAGIFLLMAWYNNSFIVPTSLHAWLYIFALGILATALPIQLVLDGLKYISPIKASILSVLEPVVTVIVGFLLLDETLSLMQSLGVLIILLGAILIQFERAPE